MSLQNNTKVRIDKWLWMVRLFKTRTMANEACNAGKVKIDNVNCKPSREIKINDTIHIRLGQLQKTIQVINFPKNRIAAKFIPDYYLDITPQEEYERVKLLALPFEKRDNNVGRPTKRDRRQIDYLKDFLSVDE
ncbi:MAG: RNA-binding S4 domain-containing protein [Bacteroidales bacterium]|jgi:ribosome-associated heat shock protein Hsp15|nr:RNA-binding S4 domain-containing protein [Bacteroidales bacterium]